MGTRVSVLMPAYNEADNLAELVPQVAAVLDRAGESYEIVVVDDGSTDGTRGVMQRLRSRHGPLHPAAPQRREVGRPEPGPGARRGASSSSSWTPTARTTPRRCPASSHHLRGRATSTS